MDVFEIYEACSEIIETIDFVSLKLKVLNKTHSHQVQHLRRHGLDYCIAVVDGYATEAFIRPVTPPHQFTLTDVHCKVILNCTYFNNLQ